MFGFKRKSKPGRVGDRAAHDRVVEGQFDPAARLPEGTLGPEEQSPPEYIAEAATPTEDEWAREQARYREKNRTEPD